jgi:hypothetical protein
MNYFEIPVGDGQLPERDVNGSCTISRTLEVRNGRPWLEFSSGYDGKAGILASAEACTGWHEIGVNFLFIFDCRKGWRKRNLYPPLRNAVRDIHLGEGKWINDATYEVDDYLQYRFKGPFYAVPEGEIPRLQVLLGAIKM